MSRAKGQSESARRKRWRQFSLRTLALFIAVFCLSVSVLVRLWRRHQAVEAVCQLDGGYVAYDYEYDVEQERWTNSAAKPGPEWLRRLLGDRLFDGMFRDVIRVGIGANLRHPRYRGPKNDRTSISDEDLKRLTGLLPPLGDARLWVTTSRKVTDGGLAHLKRITQLTHLDLAESQVTDAGLIHLRHAANLQHLDLMATKVGGVGLAPLAPFTKLRYLNLTSTPVADSGLSCLKGADFSELRELYLFETKISDVGLSYLRNFRGIEALDLGNTNITNAGLSELSPIKSLQRLNLYGTRITDAGFVHLKKLPALVFLSLRRTQVVGDGLRNLPDKLEYLILEETPVTDDALAQLEGHGNLETLDLSTTSITDRGLMHLTRLRKLKRLYLDNCRITDAGLPYLKALASLREISLMNAAVTYPGLNELQQALPGLAIPMARIWQAEIAGIDRRLLFP